VERACSSLRSRAVSGTSTRADTITARELADRLARGEVDLVDVRSPEEYERGRIAGALHRTADQLAADPGDLGTRKLVVFYCRSGERSAPVADAFVASGRKAASLEGGLEAWAQAGLELDPPDGEVAPYIFLPPA